MKVVPDWRDMNAILRVVLTSTFIGFLLALIFVACSDDLYVGGYNKNMEEINRHIFVIGLIASIGFTVSLFVTTAAFPTSGAGVTDDQIAVSNAAKLGALLSFAGAAIAFAGAKALGIKPDGDSDDTAEEATE